MMLKQAAYQWMWMVPLIALQAVAAPAPVAKSLPVYTYQIQQKDTVYDLSHQLLENPNQWGQVVAFNHIRDPKRLTPGSELKIPIAWLKGTPVKATVVNGRLASGNGKPLMAGDSIAEGDNLLTEKDGSLVLRLPDGSQVLLQGGSQVSVDKLRARPSAGLSSKLKLQKGRVETHANPDKVPNTNMEVSTPLSIAGVRGTQFRVALDEAGTHASGEVTEGEVGYQGGKSLVSLPAGFGSQVDGSGVPIKPIALLAAPTLLLPDAAYDRVLFKLSWQAIEQAAAYRVMIATDERFTHVVLSTVVTEPTLKLTDLEDGHYWVSVRAIDAIGLEGLDSTALFKLKARPEPPFVLTPKMVAKATAGNVKFEWGQPEGIHQYHFQLATSTDFSKLVFDEMVTNTTSLNPELKEGQYYWRLASIRQKDSEVDQGPYSDLGSLLVRPAPSLPSKPIETANSLSFNWKGEADQRFVVQLSDDKAFKENVLSFSTETPTLTIPRPDAGEWFIRIKAIDPDGFESSFTKPQKFMIYRRLVTSDGQPVLNGQGEPITAPTN
ncbi:FecR domain-containing protein [Leeia sp. TBRC 13508]|uniref:FecR domain-containing protein n=1 Tax=Leeia speluncae TaxID=2884804 RepID=A0ABS8D735_9NEIS|nr:FecR domain-containing protein [Leeia speluncae]MCB6183453.1 FecR domain-containing protein [Leeia speluncae]